MEFSTLPWFIRRDIIDLVIEKRTVYGLVNKEWLKRVAARHGELRYYMLPEKEVPISIITQEARKVQFQRDNNIDWDIIWGNKNINNLSFEVSYEETSKASKELFSNCLLFPSIKRCKFIVNETIPLGPKYIIEKNQNNLEELAILTFSDKWHTALKEMAFPNLRHLDLMVGGNPLNFIELVSKFPRLNNLKLQCSIPQDPILFNSHKLPSMTELNLFVSCESNDGATRVNLANLPNLKKLQLLGSYKFIGEKNDNNIEFLDTPVGDKDLSWIMCDSFIKLKTLSLSVDYIPKSVEFTKIFQFFDKLTDLRLEISRTPDIPISLSVGSNNLTALTLKGYFKVTSDLLYWLSNSFKLKRLFLHGCDLEDKALLKVLPFDHLQFVGIQVNAKLTDLYKDYFSKANCPRIDVIEITSCGLCNHVLNFFSDSNSSGESEDDSRVFRHFE